MPRWLAVQYLQLYQSYGFESKFNVRRFFHGKRISSQIWPETRYVARDGSGLVLRPTLQRSVFILFLAKNSS